MKYTAFILLVCGIAAIVSCHSNTDVNTNNENGNANSNMNNTKIEATNTNSYSVMSVKKILDPGAMPDNLPFTPEVSGLNMTKYSPWFTMYHMQSEAELGMGRRAGEGGQIVMGIARSPVDNRLMLMGTDTSGLWRSTDGGGNWTSINDNINMWAVPDIEFHPKDRNIVYIIQSVSGAGANEEKLDKTTLDGVYKSIDGGLTWQQVLHAKVGCSTASNRLLTFDSACSLYVLTSEGIFKTSDGGVNWVNLGTKGIGTMCDLYVSDNGKTIIAASIETGLTVSFDGGKTWEDRSRSLGKPAAYGIAVDPADKRHWYASFGDDTISTGIDSAKANGSNKDTEGKALSGRGLYESNDAGKTWAFIETPRNSTASYPVKVLINPDKYGKNVNLIIVNSMMSYPFRYSTDGGKTWLKPSVSNNDIAVPDTTGYYSEGICISNKNPDLIYYSFGDIIYKSINGGQDFEYCSSGFSGNLVNNFLFTETTDGECDIYFAYIDKGLGVTGSKYSARGYPAINMMPGIGRYKGSSTVGAVSIDPADNGHILISIGKWEEQVLSETRDAGATWVQIAETGSISPFNLIKFHPQEPDVIYTTNYISRDGGKTWVKNDMSLMAVSDSNPDVLLFVSGKNVFRSSDRGLTREFVTSVSSDIKSAIFDCTDSNIIWVGCANGSIVKISGLQTTAFSEADGILKFGNGTCLIQAISQNPADPNHLIAGGRCTAGGTKSPGLYETYNGGKNWHIVYGLPSTRNVRSIAFAPNTKDVFIGTYSGMIIYDYEKFKEQLN